MSGEVWILGATGRVGRAVAARLHDDGVRLVLVGRHRERLGDVTAQIGGRPRLVVGALAEALAELAQDPPAVVVNTVGPFTATAARVGHACPPGTHYVDVANEIPALQAIFDLGSQAAAADSVFVTGAGFGVLATESVLLRLCDGQPPAARVRVDALASVATEPGTLGPALAASIIEGLAFGGQEVRGGRLVETALGADPTRLTTPDGEVLSTANAPTGELLAAWRVSHADNVVAASSMVPSGTAVRLALPLVLALIRIPRVRAFAIARVAAVRTRERERPRPFSWAHARAEWSTGTVREGWLRAGDGMDFTVAVTTEVTHRLLRGDGRPGAHTPGSLFGADLAEAAGAEFLIPHHEPPAAPRTEGQH